MIYFHAATTIEASTGAITDFDFVHRFPSRREHTVLGHGLHALDIVCHCCRRVDFATFLLTAQTKDMTLPVHPSRINSAGNFV
eukprot:3129004-Amphidinium_carterae.1